MGIKNKRGFGHFEMVISFVFFMGFMAFLFIALPMKVTNPLPEVVSASLHDTFVKRISTNLSTMFLKANYTGQKNCFYIDLPDNLFSYKILNGSSRVTKVGGQFVESYIIGNELNIEKGAAFFNVAISPEFKDNGTSGCEKFDDYTIGSSSEMKVASYNSLEEMQKEYFNNYEKLKKELGVPPIFEFTIVAETMPIKMEPKQGIPDSVQIIAKSYMIEVLKSDGSLTNERFILKIW